MNKVVLSAVAALAISAVPAFAADMPVKATKVVAPAPAPSMFDVAFGTAFTTDYVLRGISQSNNSGAVQGYIEPRFIINDMFTVYVGIWGSSLWTGYANAEFDYYGGVRLTLGNFGLDVGYVYYDYPGGVPNGAGSFGEFYAKPSYKFNDWLTVGAILDGGNNFNDGLGIVGSKTAYYYSVNATIGLPFLSLPWGVTAAINPEIGRQVFDCTGCIDYTYWDVGLVLNYKAATLDLRYWDTDLGAANCTNAVGRVTCDQRFVATLKFDTTLAALK